VPWICILLISKFVLDTGHLDHFTENEVHYISPDSFRLYLDQKLRGFRVNRDTGALKNYSIETAAAHPAASRVHPRRRRMKAEPGNPYRNLS
ncbi:MAG: hypothetical protein LUQ51_03440, partial [Methanothrix sp.]|nr:hypothetical protein [Methanothrix sp.]